jgi:glycosyltransferase involved in cell wall biosynthesis
LERLACDCKQIEFVPAAPNEIALKVMAGCSVFALASRTEGLARVLLEAMAAGKPIVAFAVGGTSHCITHNENGILVEPGNVAALAAGLDRVMNSPELAKRLGAKARTRVFSDFDEHAYTRAFDAMLRSLEQGTLRSVQEQEQESAKSWHLGHTSAGRG